MMTTSCGLDSLAGRPFSARDSRLVRTHLNGVLGMTQLALATDLTARQRIFLQAARESAMALLKLVEDLEQPVVDDDLFGVN
jgi:hypothetical protein